MDASCHPFSPAKAGAQGVTLRKPWQALVMAFFVYMLASRRNGTLYIGATEDLGSRMDQHRSGTGVHEVIWRHDPGLVRNPRKPESALRRERVMKEWKRAWKIALIEKANSGWNDLSSQIPI